MNSGWLTPNQTGVLLLILLAIVFVCGIIDDYIRRKKEEKYLNSIINKQNNGISIISLNQKTGKILFNVNGTFIPGGRRVKYRSSRVYRLKKDKGNIIHVDVIRSRRKEKK